MQLETIIAQRGGPTGTNRIENESLCDLASFKIRDRNTSTNSIDRNIMSRDCGLL